MKNIILVFIFLQLTSCAFPPVKIDTAKNYKLDIFISNRPSGDQYQAEGMIVLPKKLLYTITFEAESRINYISFKTCSREITANDPSVGLNRKKYLINYAPNEIEKDGKCPTLISAFNKEGMLSVGFISYEDPSFPLSAINICGEKTMKTNGASVCQGRVGSIQRIRFEQEMITSPDEGCEMESETRSKEFTYQIKKGFCAYIFVEIKQPHRMHKLDTYGYNEIQIKD